MCSICKSSHSLRIRTVFNVYQGFEDVKLYTSAMFRNPLWRLQLWEQATVAEYHYKEKAKDNERRRCNSDVILISLTMRSCSQIAILLQKVSSKDKHLLFNSSTTGLHIHFFHLCNNLWIPCKVKDITLLRRHCSVVIGHPLWNEARQNSNYMHLETLYIRFNSCAKDKRERTLILALHLDHE